MMKDTLLIDGLCGLCSRSAKFISNRQVKDLEIIEQHSDIGSDLLRRYKITADSLVLIRKNKAYIRSAAAIRCLLYLRWNWIWMFPFVWLVPLPIRDLVYLLISKFRK